MKLIFKKSLSLMLLLSLMLMAFSFIQSGEKSVKAVDSVASYTIGEEKTVSSTGAPLGSSATYSQTYSTTYQITKNNSITLTLSGYDDLTISKIVLSMKSNSKAGSGSLQLTVGEKNYTLVNDKGFNTADWNGAYSSSYVDITKSFEDKTVGADEDVIIKISASVSSLYCNRIDVYYKLSQCEVSFNTNGGNTIDPIEVENGTILEKPSDPVKDGFTFIKWMHEDNEWNFEEDIVTSDMTLTAIWINNDLLEYNESIDNINSYMSLGYKYTVSKEIKYDESEEIILLPNSNVHTGSVTVSSLTEIDLSNHFNINEVTNDMFSIKWYKNTASNFYFKTGEIRLYKGGSYIEVKLKDEISDKYTIKGFRALNNSNIEVTSDIEISIIENEGIAKLTCTRTGSGNITINKLEITLELKEKKIFDYDDVDFRIRCGIDSSVKDIIESLDDATYGIEVTDGDTTKHFPDSKDFSDLKEDLENNIDYVVIDLGDVLSNLERLNVNFSVRAFVEYQGDKYYSNQVKQYSLVDLVKEYSTNGTDEVKASVQGLVELLTELGMMGE